MIAVVSDTSPLSLLVRLDLLEILPRLFVSVSIKPEVAQEMGLPKAPTGARGLASHRPAWIHIEQPGAVSPIPGLDPGELAAIALALKLSVPLLIDERAGREAATALGIAVLGVIGVREEAASRGLVSDLAQVHAQIRGMRFHVSEQILSASLTRHLSRVQPGEGAP